MYTYEYGRIISVAGNKRKMENRQTLGSPMKRMDATRMKAPDRTFIRTLDRTVITYYANQKEETHK